MEVDSILAFIAASEVEYFVTFKGKSYLHAAWVNDSVILAGGLQGKHKLQRCFSLFLLRQIHDVQSSSVHNDDVETHISRTSISLL